MRMLDQQEENDTTVSWEDQKSINEFSRLYASYGEAQAELTKYRDDKEALDDLVNEVELVDEEESVPYLVGSTFVHLVQPVVLERAQADAARAEKKIATLEDQADQAEAAMKELKVKLYARFGTNITKWEMGC